MGLSRGEVLSDVVGASTTEDDDIQKRVGTETVSTVDGDTSSLASGVQSGDDLVLAVFVNRDDFTSVLGRDTTHCPRVSEGEQQKNTDVLL